MRKLNIGPLILLMFIPIVIGGIVTVITARNEMMKVNARNEPPRLRCFQKAC